MRAKASNSRRVWRVFQSPVIHTGLFAGVLLVGVMIGSLIVANRMPQFDAIASLRNLAFYALFGLVMTIPIARYLWSPWRLFTSGITAWMVLAGAYACATMFFENLINRLYVTPFHVLMLGGVMYGVIAVMAWVASSFVSLLGHAAPVPLPRPVPAIPPKR